MGRFRSLENTNGTDLSSGYWFSQFSEHWSGHSLLVEKWPGLSRHLSPQHQTFFTNLHFIYFVLLLFFFIGNEIKMWMCGVFNKCCFVIGGSIAHCYSRKISWSLQAIIAQQKLVKFVNFLSRKQEPFFYECFACSSVLDHFMRLKILSSWLFCLFVCFLIFFFFKLSLCKKILSNSTLSHWNMYWVFCFSSRCHVEPLFFFLLFCSILRNGIFVLDCFLPVTMPLESCEIVPSLSVQGKDGFLSLWRVVSSVHCANGLALLFPSEICAWNTSACAFSKNQFLGRFLKA